MSVYRSFIHIGKKNKNVKRDFVHTKQLNVFSRKQNTIQINLNTAYQKFLWKCCIFFFFVFQNLEIKHYLKHIYGKYFSYFIEFDESSIYSALQCCKNNQISFYKKKEILTLNDIYMIFHRNQKNNLI